jgi:hypothetical protein
MMNTPGYLPVTELLVFASAAEAWDYLREERERQEDDEAPDEENYSATREQLATLATAEHWQDGAPVTLGPIDATGAGTVYGPTPGTDSEHDLGIAYSVTVVEGPAEELIDAAIDGACEVLLDLAMVYTYDELTEDATAHAADWQTPAAHWQREPFDADSLATIIEDVRAMIDGPDGCAGADFEEYVSRRLGDGNWTQTAEGAAASFGTDFVLTRNHHGAGFWDRGLGDLGDRLTEWAQTFGDQTATVTVDADGDQIGDVTIV